VERWHVSISLVGFWRLFTHSRKFAQWLAFPESVDCCSAASIASAAVCRHLRNYFVTAAIQKHGALAAAEQDSAALAEHRLRIPARRS